MAKKRMKRVKVVRTSGGTRRVVTKGRTVVREVDGTQQQPAKQVRPLPAPSNGSLTVGDKHIRAMMADPRFTSAIPCLSSGQTKLNNTGKVCGRCSRKRSQYIRETMGEIRRCLASLPDPQRKQLKKLLQADDVTLITKGGKGQVKL